MARVASRNYYDDDDDIFGNVTEGIKTGLGIAQTYHNIENAKSSRAFNEAQLKDFNRAEASRNAGYDAAEAKSNAEKYKLEQDMKTVYATAATHTIYNAMKMEDQAQAFAHIQREMPTVTNGQFNVSFGQVQGPDGPSNVAQFTTKDGGKAEMYFNDMADFTKQFNNLRQQHGLFTFGERDMAKRADIAESLWNTLTPDEQIKYGSFGEFTKDPRVRDHIDLMATKDNFSGAEARQTTKEWDQKDEKHGWGREEHNSQMASQSLYRDNLRQEMGFRADDQAYKIKVTRPNEEAAHRALMDGKNAEYLSAIADGVDKFFPHLAPTAKSVGGQTVTTESGEIIDLGGGKTATSYDESQIKERNFIIRAAADMKAKNPEMQLYQAYESAKLSYDEATRKQAQATAEEVAKDDSDKKRKSGVKKALGEAQEYLDERDMKRREKEWGDGRIGIEGAAKRELDNKVGSIHRQLKDEDRFYPRLRGMGVNPR